MKGSKLSITTFNGTASYLVDTENLPAGMYLMRVTDTSGRYHLVKVMKD